MGNVSLKVLEKSWNFLFKNGYEPCKFFFPLVLKLDKVPKNSNPGEIAYI